MCLCTAPDVALVGEMWTCPSCKQAWVAVPSEGDRFIEWVSTGW